MQFQSYTLRFSPELMQEKDGKDVRDGLSAALLIGENLWLCCDEHTTVERLRRTGPRTFGKHCSYELTDLLKLPDEKTEIDLEGIAEAENYLWVLGSHSIKRKNVDGVSDDAASQIADLAKIRAVPNRCLLARIPLVVNPKTGDYELLKKAAHPTADGKKLHAAHLRYKKDGSNELLEVLRKDEHIGRYLEIPCKENGFDVEGMAVTPDGRVFLGLRGPVLHGWAIVLEIRPEEHKKGELRLSKLEGGSKKYYKKHFVQLQGMGIREIRIQGPDMFILAGPTMDLDGVVAVYRWRDAVFQAHDSITPLEQLERLFDVPHLPGLDRAEGMAVLDPDHMLIVFDRPSPKRKAKPYTTLANCYHLPPA